jgi:peptide/nickel transport system permease protein
MHRYLLKRVLMLIPIIIGVTFIVFFILSLTPGDPAALILGNGATPESIAELREKMGLNDPVIIQYLRYLGNLFTGDLGTSYKTGASVFQEVIVRFPNTFILAVSAMFISVVFSIPLGVFSAVHPYSFADSFAMVFALIGISIPTFWMGLMLIIIFSVNLKWFPSSGFEGIKNLVLPSIALGLYTMATITRTTRSTMLEVIRQDYIRTALAKGVKKRAVIWKHAISNALIPTVTVVGLEFGSLLGGAVVLESVFAWPGIGRLMVNSINSRDTPMVLGCIIILAISFTIVNLAVDILYAYIDPRIKSQYSGNKKFFHLAARKFQSKVHS